MMVRTIKKDPFRYIISDLLSVQRNHIKINEIILESCQFVKYILLYTNIPCIPLQRHLCHRLLTGPTKENVTVTHLYPRVKWTLEKYLGI